MESNGVDSMESHDNPPSGGLTTVLEGRRGGLILNVAIAVMLILGLFLPPISVQARILDAGYTRIDPDEGGSVSDPDGMQVTVWPEGLDKDVKLKVESVPNASFNAGSAGRNLKEAAAALEATGNTLRAKSPIYEISVKGPMPSVVTLSVPIPNNAEPYETLSLYSWSGENWEFVPSKVIVEDDVLESRLDYVPEAVAAFQSGARPTVVSVEIPEYVSLPEMGAQAIAELNPLGYYLAPDYGVEGSVPSLTVPEGQESYRVLPTLRNWTDDGVVRSDLVDNMLILPESREANIQAIVDLVAREMYAGIDLDYRGINPDLRGEYTEFAQQLGEELDATGKRFTLHAGAPAPVSADTWDTGAYDWRRLSQAADSLKFPAPQEPEAYAPGAMMESLLRWSVSEVERYRLQPVFSTGSVENAGGVLLEQTYRDALKKLGALAVREGGRELLIPGDQVSVGLDTAAVQTDPATGRHWFTYHDDVSGQERTVWLEDASSLSRKLALMSQFNLGGVAFRNLWDEGNDPRIWDLIREYQASLHAPVAPVSSTYSVMWSVEDASGGQISEQTAAFGQSDYVWVAPEAPGSYQIGASIVANDGQTVAGGEKVAFVVAQPTPTPTPVPPTPTPIPPTPTPVPPTPTPVPPTPTPTTRAQSGGGSSQPKPTPLPAANNPAPNTNFGYGIQAHMVHNGQEGMVMSQINDMGFGWAKQQVEWKHFEPSKGAYQWDSLDNIAGAATGAGVKVLWSVVNAPMWSRPGGDLGVGGPPNNPQDFADFLGALAGRYCGSSVKAIEVWNEQNLHYEWGNMTINPAAYMDLLKPSYRAIKQACPSMIVVSGAPTPTGAPPPLAMDDYQYLEGMYQAGLKDYSDAIGAHPSGFNVPPSSMGGQSACDAITKDGASYRGPCNTLHHSWSFNATLNGYYNIMKKYGDGRKKIWPTEFGWASGWTGAPGYEYADDNTPQEQAAWTVEAYKLMKQWGFVGVAFLWNLNFRVVAGGTEKAQWGIVSGDWSPLPAYQQLKAMAK
jgi:hypothetical protein